MKSVNFIVDREDRDRPLQDVLADRLHLSRNGAKRLIDQRHVCINRRRVWMARHVLRTGDTVDLLVPDAERETEAPIPVLYRDKAVIVVNKPAGLLANGSYSVESRVRAESGQPGIEAVHRLDRDTSGCMLLALNAESLRTLIEQFRKERVGKTYHAIVSGELQAAALRVTRPLDDRTAVTTIRTLEASRLASHLMIRIETGRTHQIRRHLATLGHPVLGDREYCTRLRADPRFVRIERQMLHAFRLEFDSVESGQRVRVEAPLPSDFRRCLRLFQLT